ncbi:MAG: hypothetical protein JXR77_12620 [Lentisphaeria bacterium]|nr:hypothetical protein [Lentisphaeria bacterium]
MNGETMGLSLGEKRSRPGLRLLVASLLIGLPRGAGESRTSTGMDLASDTWVGVDALGRHLPGPDVCGPPRAGKTVALFYWTWHIRENGGARGPFDNTRITAQARAEGRPVTWPAARANHHWGEPELGYYLSTDPFVIRRHASLLADAGVDVIVFDTSNPPWTWKDAHQALCREYAAMRREGNRTPEIAFLCPFGDPTVVVDRLLEELYAPRLFEDLWFRWRGKPLILADPKPFRERPGIREFFTFRKPIPGYWTRPGGPGQWPWLQVHPQHGFPDESGQIEAVAVGVAQNAIPGTFGPAPMSHRQGAMGRSWRDGARDPDPDAGAWGLNFQEQWDRAMALDPQVVFVTGWNEWTAIRLPSFGAFNEREHPYHRGGLFVDQYNREYSRDCEPMRGGHGDNYYYQLMADIRRFKGVRPRPRPGGPSAIVVDGRFDDWSSVQPEYRDTAGDTLHRDHSGYGNTRYRNDTGRNDIVACKAAYDREHVFFAVETRAPLSAPPGRHWMLLFVDADQDHDSGWEGYDLLVEPGVPASVAAAPGRVLRLGTTTAWTEVCGVPVRTAGQRMELAVPRSALGEDAPDGTPALDFHWADGILRIAVEEFGSNGDSAPNRRCNYRFGPDPDRSAPPLGYFGPFSRDAAEAPVLADAWLDLDGCDWIWHPSVPEAVEQAPVGRVRFRRHWDGAAAAEGVRVFLVIAADNVAEVSLNGKMVGSVSGWTPPTAFPIVPQAGRNILEVTVGNLGDAPNPAGLALRILLLGEDGRVTVPARSGDGDWETSRVGEDAWVKPVVLAPVGGGPWGELR